MPRAGLNTDRVVAAAAELADEVGLDQLTLAALAARLGVRQPSLYKHVASIERRVRARPRGAGLMTAPTPGEGAVPSGEGVVTGAPDVGSALTASSCWPGR